MKYKLLKLLTISLFLLTLFTIVVSVKSQSSTGTYVVNPSGRINNEKARKFGIKYPIKELNNCASFLACHEYCSIKENKDACIAYAKSKGFYKEEEENAKRKELLKNAKLELGCGDETCIVFCSKEENQAKCEEFRKKYKPVSEKIKQFKSDDKVAKARSLLGCRSAEECRKFCDSQEKKQKCSVFFKKLGLRRKIFLENKAPSTATPSATLTPLISVTQAATPTLAISNVQGATTERSIISILKEIFGF